MKNNPEMIVIRILILLLTIVAFTLIVSCTTDLQGPPTREEFNTLKNKVCNLEKKLGVGPCKDMK